ncbi:hypothetical protein [Streptomyces asiaticus]|uniref:hypothetical protein n=1 Tax=Streptomyces asiaticus TaxID=114695 RepID=UPI0037FD2CE1
MPTPDPEFDDIIESGYYGKSMNNPHQHTETSPYGGPVQHHKPGLTKRGKAALGIGAAVIAGGGLIGYQAYSASTAESEAKAQEIALKQQQLKLEQMKELNRAKESGQKTEKTVSNTRQKQIDACVKDNKDLVGKSIGSSYRDIVDACQAQYADTTASGDDMEAAGSADDASNGGDGVNNFVLLGGGAIAVGLVALTKKGKRGNPA